MKKSRLFLFLTILVGVFLVTNFDVNAEEQVGKIVGNYTYGEEKLTNADASIYVVGTVEASASSYTYELLDAFKEEKVDYPKLTTQQLEEHVKKLFSIIEENDIKPINQVKTDINGQFTFDGLKSGLYLIKVDDLKVNDRVYKSSPILIFFPDVAGDGSYVYSASVNMKTEMSKVDDSGNNNGDDDNNNNGDNNNSQIGGSNVNAPNTYDAIVMYVALFIVSAVLLAVLICYIYIYNKKKGKKEYEKNE